MKKLITFFFVFILFYNYAKSQGCIAFRNISGFGQYNLTDNAFSNSSLDYQIFLGVQFRL